MYTCSLLTVCLIYVLNSISDPFFYIPSVMLGPQLAGLTGVHYGTKIDRESSLPRLDILG